MTKAYRPLLLLVLAALCAACAESEREEATGEANIRAINAIVNAPNVSFLIEQVNLGNVAFKDSLGVQRFDDLSYDFRFRLSVPGESEPRVLDTEFVDVERDRDYVFVLDGTVQNPEILVWNDELRMWDDSETVFEMRFAHLADTVGEVDVYFLAPGTQPVAGNQVATLANGERSDAMEFEEGDYEVTLTPPGDPQTVLYTSGERSYVAATTDAIVVFDKDPSVTGDINVRHIASGGSATELADPRFPPQARFMNAAFGVGNVDIAENDDFNPPLVTDLAFGESTADTDLAAGEASYTFTDAGNMGAILMEQETTNSVGLHYNRVLTGPADQLGVINQPSERRPFSTNPRFSFVHAASNLEAVDLYLLSAGESIEDNNPGSANQEFPSVSALISVAADNYEVTLTLPGEKTVVGGPEPVDLAAGDVVQIFFLDTADPNVVDFEVVRLAP